MCLAGGGGWWVVDWVVNISYIDTITVVLGWLLLW